MIPEGWERVSLGDIAQVTGGKRLPKGRTLEVDPTPHPYIRVSDMQMGKLDDSSIQYLPVDLGPVLKRYRVNAGDLIISVAGTLGVICRVPDDLHGANLTENADRISGFKCDSNFLFHALMDEKLQQAIQSSKTTNAQPKLALDKIRSFTISLPPKEEQGRIAATLQTWDRAIETVEALIANARAQKQALMQQLLPQGTTPPKKRLPGFLGEWREIRLGAAFSERVERGEDGLALLSVTQACGVIPQEHAGRRNISSADQSNYKTVCAGDIAYNTMRMWQGASALSGLTGKVSPAYTVVTPRNGHDALFYSYLFKQPKMIHVFERHSQGLVSDTWNLKFPHFAKIRICIPGIEEQVAIAAAFKSLDDLSVAYEAQLTALRQEKAALMQQLLTGKRRVKLPESEVAHA